MGGNILAIMLEMEKHRSWVLGLVTMVVKKNATAHQPMGNVVTNT
jgi:hypothetical protein